LSGPLPASRETQTFPVVQRTSIRFFRRITRTWTDIFRDIGARTYFMRDIARAFGDPATYAPETIRQMKNIGVDSVPLTVIVAAFIGGVIALQTRYQLLPGVQLSIIGLASRLMVVLELGPLLTGLVLTGRVGGRMTAEIGTMRVTEQIDALETLAYDPMAFLIVPRLLAAVVMLPTLVVLADAVGLGSAYLVSVRITDVTPSDFITGLRLGFGTFQVV
jgi:phospholipid/cholesterol/gamma-HCH transport system permease protein